MVNPIRFDYHGNDITNDGTSNGLIMVNQYCYN